MERSKVRRRLGEAFNHPDPDQGLTNARRLAGVLDKTYPDAAASIREGLEDMFTVRRLGVTDTLLRTLMSTSWVGDRTPCGLVGRRSPCPRPPNRTCTFPRIRLSTCVRQARVTSSLTFPTNATSSWFV
jgi:hypothetical protein